LILPKSFEAVSKFKKQMTAIRELVEDLNKFSDNIRKTYSGIDEDAIKNLEANIRYALPKDFKEFLRLCNGFSLLSDIIYGIHPKDKVMDIYSKVIIYLDVPKLTNAIILT
jgi:cell wall assembly regulator SMI1